MEIPEIRKVKVDDIIPDETNPNIMGKEEFEALKEGIKRFGFIVPIITNKDMIIADGFHRWKAAKELGMEYVSVFVLNVKEVDRLMLRQIMNKLKGQHNIDKDIQDFDKILAVSGSFKDLAMLMGKKEQYFDDIMKLKDVEMEQYLVLRKMDEDLKDKGVNIRQLKIALLPDQLDKIKEKFGDTNMILEIVDYFIVVDK